MSDVGAVVLTVGEGTTGRALGSLEAQTVPPGDVVVVEGVRPFHRALNTGAERVTTPFFVQVDADMVLDPECVEVLRHGMASGVGIAVGALRDPIRGAIAGVKMFRRSCFDTLRLRDTVAPEIDFYMTLQRLGWLTQCVVGHRGRWARSSTLGAHCPDYTVDYVFGTYYLVGRLYAHRRDARSLGWRFAQLRRSDHPMAPVARLSMAHGVTGSETRDVAKPRPVAADSSFLGRLAASPEDASVHPHHARQLLTALDPGSLFTAFRELGAHLRDGSHGALRTCLRMLGDSDHPRSLLAEVGLGHGAMAAGSSAAAADIEGALERIPEAWRLETSAERAT